MNVIVKKLHSKLNVEVAMFGLFRKKKKFPLFKNEMMQPLELTQSGNYLTGYKDGVQEKQWSSQFENIDIL